MPAKLGNLPSLDFAAKTSLVTGTTNGMGLAVSEALLDRHLSTLIMGVRDVKKGEALKARLLTDFNPSVSARVYVLQLDMEDYESVVAFSNEVKKLTTSLDIVILNAGTGGLNFELSKSGHEKMIQVNLLSNALLALELLPLLTETSNVKKTPSRLTWVGSFTQTDHSLNKSPIAPDGTVLGHFDNETKFKGLARYPDSKLLTTMFVQELAQHINPKAVILNEVSPGPVNTNFGATYPVLLRMIFAVVLGLRARPVSEAVKTYLYAVGVAGTESHGKYLSDNKIAPRAPFVDTPEGRAIQKRLFQELLEDCKRADPRISIVGTSF